MEFVNDQLEFEIKTALAREKHNSQSEVGAKLIDGGRIVLICHTHFFGNGLTKLFAD